MKKKTKVLELNTDRDLIAGVREGDIASFDILFRKYCQKLYRFAYSFLASREDAEEMVQEVFAQLWENRTELNQDYSFNSYIFTITKNKVLNVIRKRVYEKKYRDSISVKQVLYDFSTEEQVHYSELLEISEEAIEALPPRRKQIFRMSRQQGMTYEEIARDLGISIKTVENQMTIALRTLRSYLIRHAEIPFLLTLFLLC